MTATSGSGSDSASSAIGSCTRTSQPEPKAARSASTVKATAVECGLPLGSATMSCPPSSSMGSSSTKNPLLMSSSYSLRVQCRLRIG
jgi:hypothetical protein